MTFEYFLSAHQYMKMHGINGLVKKMGHGMWTIV